MSSKIIRNIESLKRCIDTQHPKEAKEFIDSIITSFEEELEASEIDFAIESIFNASTGTVAFLKKTLSQNKIFKVCNAELFKLYRVIIQRYKKKISRYGSTIEVCLKPFIQTASTSAREKELCILILQDLVIHGASSQLDVAELVEELLKIFSLKDPPARFLNYTFELLGLFAKDYPEKINDENALKMRNCYLNTLENQLLKMEKLSFATIGGAIQGLNDFLINFAPSINEEPIVCKRIYDCVFKLSDPDDLKEKAAFRNSLALLATHSPLFSINIFTDYVYWQKNLLKWISSSNWENRKCGILAIHAFHREIASCFESRNSISRNPDDEVILNYFLKYFKSILATSSSKPYEIRIAIRGLGWFAASCKLLLSTKFVNEIFSLVIQRTEYSYLTSKGDRDRNRDTLEHLPDFVQALSQIMANITELSGIQITSLQNIIISLIRDFHYLSKIQHDLVVRSIMMTFHNLQLLGESILEKTLEKIILQGVIWTCSHKLIFDTEWQDETDWKENVTYKKYLPMWLGLFDNSSRSSLNRTAVIEKIYNIFINSLFIVLDKLNLSTKKRTFYDESGVDQEYFFSDPNIDLNPVKPKDFHIFFNLVDFYSDVLLSRENYENNRKYFKPWVLIYGEHMILKSIKYPLVSGFLKLLQVGVRLAEKANYFDARAPRINDQFTELLTHTLKSLIPKAQKVSGELQLACLKLILTMPIHILDLFEKQLKEIIKLSFDIGKSMLWLADITLTCLQKFISFKLTSEDKNAFLQEVLPSLDSFLQSRGNVEDASLNVEIVRYKNQRRVRKVFNSSSFGESELFKLQRRILVFLGTLNPQVCLYMISQKSEDFDNLVKWDTEKNISLVLQCGDMQPIIHLDTIIARVSVLAMTSSDRKMKIASCELLHGLILYLLGKSYHKGETWKKLCKNMIYLSCDTDLAVQQLFEPLLMQTIHYLSQPIQLLTTGTIILLDSLMEMISHPSNSSVRDLAARSLREFVQWSIKQTTPAQQKSSPANIVILIAKLRAFSLDSDHKKRLGAAIAFNNLYRLLREEESIINVYWLEILYTFSMNYIMSEEFDVDSDFEQISACLDHILRVLLVRRDIFNKIDENRRTPKGFRNSSLKETVIWLLEQCGTKHANYRHKTMEMFTKLVVAIDGNMVPKQFIAENFSSEQLREIFEGEPQSGIGIAARPNLNFLKDGNIFYSVGIYAWLEQFLQSLDCYVWCLTADLIVDYDGYFSESVIFNTIIYYLKDIASSSYYDIVSSINPRYFTESVDSLEMENSLQETSKINNIKCTILIRIIDLLSLVLSKQKSCLTEDFWSSFVNSYQIMRVILKLIFQPQNLGYEITADENTMKLRYRVDNFLKQLEINADEEYKSKIFRNIMKELSEHLEVVLDTAEATLSSDNVRLDKMNRVIGLEYLTKYIKSYARYLTPEMAEAQSNSAEKLLTDIFRGTKQKRMNDEEFVIILPPSVRKYSNILIKISFNLRESLSTIIDLILIDEVLKISLENDATVKHGKHFLDCFGKTIFNYITNYFRDFIVKIVQKINANNCIDIIKILSLQTEFIYKYKSADNDFLRESVLILLQHWPMVFKESRILENNLGYVDIHLIELMSHIAMASPFPLVQLSQKADGFGDWILKMLSDNDCLLEMKAKAMFLLPCLTGSQDLENEQLLSTLQALQIKHFPLKSSEFPAESLEYASLVTTLRAIFEALIISKSPIILKFLIQSTCADTKHVLEFEIRNCLKEFISSQNTHQQLYCLKVVFEIYTDTSLEPTVRLTIIKRFLITMLQNSQPDVIIGFFKDHAKKIMELISSNFGTSYSHGWESQQALVNRCCGFKIIECLMGNVPKDLLTVPECPIGRIILGKTVTGRVTIGELTRRAHQNAKSEVFITTDPQCAELFRLFVCAAYKALCALISNTQDELKYYEVILFRENPEKNECLWRKMINITDDLIYEELSQEFEDFPKLKDRIVSIRQITNQEAATTGYSQSSNILNSSLSQDITKLDLNYSVARTATEVAIRDARSNTNKTRSTVKLEKSKINDHEIMPVLVAVINKMYDRKLTPIPKNPGESKTVTPWVKYVADIIGNQEQHKNVRIFFAKLVDNCREVFKYYSPVMLPAVLQFIVDECSGSKLNSLITDLLVMVLSWSEIYKPQPNENHLASDVIKFLMKNAYHEEKNIFKVNLEIIQNLVEVWKDIIYLPAQMLRDMISVSDRTDTQENVCGIQLNAIVLANGLVPWTDLTRVDFIRSIFTCLRNTIKMVYQSAAQLLGMCLQQSEKEGNSISDDDPILIELKDLLEKMLKTNEKKFMDILYGTHKNYPKIIDSFSFVISTSIPNAIGVIKKAYLEMFLARVEKYDDKLFRELITLGIRDLLKQSEFQLMGLHIINKSLPHMNSKEILSILNDVIEFTDSNKLDCRDVMYEIVVYVKEHLNVNDLEHAELSQKCLHVLLRGLNDPVKEIQNRVFNFWANESKLPERMDQRMLTILNELYDTNAEKEFLGYSTQLLLQPAITNTNSTRALFDYPMEIDNKLVEYTIDTNWRQFNTIRMPPLFVESQQKNLIAGEGSQMHNLLRATQNEELFQPTLDPKVITETSNKFSLQTQNSLLFQMNPDVLDRRSNRIHISSETQNREKTFNHLRQRFIRDKDKEKRNIAYKMIEKKGFEYVRKSELIRKREGEVTLYRRYRYGDFPDLLINGLALLLPLQSIVKQDQIIARHIFVQIFNAIVKEMGGTISEDFLKMSSMYIDKILNSTKNCDSIVFAALIEVALQKPKLFNLSPAVVAVVSNASNMMSIGALYLENKINHIDDDDDSTSKTSSSTLNSETLHWLKLAEMYHSLRELDIVASIFAEKMDTHPSLARAIEMEGNNDFPNALTTYIEILQSKSSAREGTNKKFVEQDYCYQSYYNCLIEMGKWTELVDAIQKSVNSYEELWDDDWSQDVQLPHIFRGEIRLILNEQNTDGNFLTLLEQWIRDDAKSNFINLNFGEELTLLHLANEEYNMSRVYSEKILKQFVAEWGHLYVLSDKLRIEKLLNTRKLAEIYDYSNIFLSKIDVTVLQKLYEQWSQTDIDLNDSLVIWDALLTYRSFIYRLIEHSPIERNDDVLVFKTKLKNSIHDMKFSLMNSSLHQKNLMLSQKVWLGLNGRDDDDGRKTIAQTKLKILKAKNRKNPKQAVDQLWKAWSGLDLFLNRMNISELPEVHVEALEQKSRVVQKILGFTLQDNVDDQMKANIMRAIGGSGEDTFPETLYHYAVQCLKESTKIAEEIDSKEMIGEIYFRIGQYSYDCYSSDVVPKSIGMEREIIIAILRAMQFNSKEAKQFFPSLMQLPNLENNLLSDLFNEEIMLIPEWMFLGWIPQILSRLTFASKSYLEELIMRIAKSYPNVLKYAFNLSLERYKRRQDIITREFILELQKVLANTVMDRFLNCISYTSLPESIILVHVKNAYRFLMKTPNLTNIKFKNCIKTAIKLIYTDNLFPGKEFEKFAQFKTRLEEIARLDIYNDHQKIMRMLESITKSVSSWGRYEGKIRLNELNAWLGNYQWLGEEEFIELPGQYSGESRPIINNHKKIVKFDVDLPIYQTLRKPLKLTVFANDGKTYNFLIKYGDDLRQDQRIQQLLELMSSQMKCDRNCKYNNLSIITYKVFPISYYCGLISWVDNTTSIRNFLIKAMDATNNTAGALNILRDIKDKYKQFLTIPTNREENPRTDDFNIYGLAAKTYKREQIVANYLALEYEIPHDIFKTAISNLAISPECFYILRNNFARSISAMNIGHWLLGIGDRHISNILINTRDCSIVGIDFGLSFGAATRDLIIPELIPFRLTPHFVSVMEPMGVTGIFKKSMIHTLRCLRNAKKILNVCYEIFINEPTVDWLDSANEKYQKEDEREWDPTTRIKTAIKKLSGHNPTALFAEELAIGNVSKNEDYMNGYLKLLKGNQQFNRRARMPEDNLSVEDQCACLIDLATDPAVLGITYEGWNAWV